MSWSPADAAQHPRDPVTGEFVRKVATRWEAPEERTFTRTARRRTTASRLRERKNQIKDVADLARGARPPTSWAEDRALEWASPRKRAEQRALTGDVKMPRIEALRRGTSLARGYHIPRTVIATNPFTGRNVAVRGYGPEVIRADRTVTTDKRIRKRSSFIRQARRNVGG